jgi:hypothetical protein
MWPLKRGVLEPKYGGASAKQRSANSLKKTSMHRATIRYGQKLTLPRRVRKISRHRFDEFIEKRCNHYR